MILGSVPSLAAGLIFGTLLGVGAFQVSRNADNYQLSLGTSALLGGLMGYRYYNSGKIMPAGLLAGIRFVNSLHVQTVYI